MSRAGERSLAVLAAAVTGAMFVSHAPLVNADPVGRAAPEAAPVSVSGEPDAPKVDLVDVSKPAAKPGDEVVGKRTAFSKTFVGSKPGEYQIKESTSRLHVKKDGKWADVDTTLKQGSDGSYAPGLTAAPVKIGGKANDANLVSVDLGGGKSIGWRLTGALAASAHASVNSAQYTNALPNATLQLEATPDGVKENIVLNSADVSNEFTFPLVLNGVSLKQTAKGIDVVDGAGKVVAFIPQGYAMDAKHASTDKVSYSLSGNTLKVMLDKAWLSDPARVFPVTVDPTTQITKDLADTLVTQDEPNIDKSQYSIMRVGLDNGGVSRGYIRISMSELVGKNITAATLKLYERYSRDCTERNVLAYPVTGSWSTSTTTWNSQPSVGSDPSGSVMTNKGGGSGCAAGYIGIPVTAKAREIATGPDANYGFSIRASETNDMAYKEFNTANNASNTPYLEATYTEPFLGIEKGYQFNTTQLTDQTTARVNTASGNLNLQGVDLSLQGVNGMGALFARWYNSRSDVTGMFGYGWSGSYGQDIKFFVDDSGSALLVGPSGYRLEMLDDGDGVHYSPRPNQGVKVKVTKNAEGDYSAYFADNSLTYPFVGGNLASIKNKTGQTITMNYTAGKLTSVTDTHGATTSYAYNAAGFVSQITAPDGRTAKFGYTGSDLTSATNTDGKTVTYAYDAAHNLTTFTDARAGKTTFGYTNDQVTAITWADATTTKYDWSAWPTVKMTDPKGTVWKWEVDDYGHMGKFYWPRDNSTSTYAYDANASVTAIGPNTGGQGTYVYDGYNIKSYTDAAGVKSNWTYDDAANTDKPTRYTNGNAIKTSYTWTGAGQLASVSQDAGGSTSKTSISYKGSGDACQGAVESSTDPNGNVTTYLYDAKCNLIKVDRPAPLGDITLTWDASNRRSSYVDGNGNKQVYTYNAKDQITKIDYYKAGSTAVTSSITYSFDANGNQTSRADSTSGTSTWVLDARNRPTNEKLPNATNAYSYDINGNLASMTEPGGTTTYAYDVENDVTSVDPAATSPITYTYTGHTQVKTAFPNGTAQIENLPNGRTSDISVMKGTTTLLKKLTYDYKNAKGSGTDQVYKINEQVANTTVTYGYDTAGRIVSSKGVKNSDGSVFENSSYTFDKNSNITGWSTISGDMPGSFTASFNAANEIVNVSGSKAASFSYDANGNMTGDSWGSAFTYDERNRAVSVKHRNSNVGAQTATYDGSSQVERTSLGGTTFTHTALGVSNKSDGAGRTNFIKSPTGEVLGQTDPNGQTSFYETDRIGSTIGVTNAAGNQVNSFWYDPNGKQSFGNAADPSKGVPQVNWKFAGYWDDSVSGGQGFYKVGLRYLDTDVNRWTQLDPKTRIVNPAQPSEASPYCYVGGNGCNHTDPTGAMTCQQVLAVFSGVLGVSGLLVLGVAAVAALPESAAAAVALALLEEFGVASIAEAVIVGTAYEIGAVVASTIEAFCG